MPIPQWLQANPYRILRLSANASIADVHKAASTMRRMTVLGMQNTTDADMPLLGEVPRTETDIRAAVGRLESPPQRAADRLFWLHAAIDTPNSDSPEDPGVPLQKAAREHDLALQGLFGLYSSTERAGDSDAWIAALKNWHEIVENENYWKLVLVLEQLGTFEPAANAEEIRSTRAGAMMMAAEPLLMLARQAVADNDRKQLQASLQVLRHFSGVSNWAHSALKETLAPLLASLSEKCRLNRENFGKRVNRETDSAQTNRQICDDELRDFRSNVQAFFLNLRGIIAKNDAEETEARETVATCLSKIASDFTWADRYTESEDLYKEALSLAEGTLVAVQIERSLTENKSSAAHQRLYEGLTAEATKGLKEAQRHCQSVLIEGRKQIVREPDGSEHNRPLCQAMLARFRSEVLPSMDTALWAAGAEHPAAKELRAEVALGLNSIATDFTWADEFQVSLQLRQEALAIGVNTHVVGLINEGIARVAENARQEKLFRELIPMKGTPGLSTINGVGGKLYGSSNHDPGTGSFETTYYFTVLYFPIIPLSRYRVIQEGNSYRFLGKLRFRKFDKWHLGIVLGGISFALLFGMVTSSSSTTSPSTTYQASPSTSYQSSSTSSSSESSSVTAEQSEIKTQIDAGRARLEILKTELEPVANEMGTLKTQIQELDSQIKALDDQKSLGESIDTEEYNSKINEYNDLISRRKSLLAANQSSFDEYEDLRKKDSQLVAQYNALIR